MIGGTPDVNTRLAEQGNRGRETETPSSVSLGDPQPKLQYPIHERNSPSRGSVFVEPQPDEAGHEGLEHVHQLARTETALDEHRVWCKVVQQARRPLHLPLERVEPDDVVGLERRLAVVGLDRRQLVRRLREVELPQLLGCRIRDGVRAALPLRIVNGKLSVPQGESNDLGPLTPPGFVVQTGHGAQRDGAHRDMPLVRRWCDSCSGGPPIGWARRSTLSN